MKLAELKVGQGKVDVEVKVKSKAEPRQFEKYGKPLRVCNAVVSDDSGEMTLSLWNEDVDKVNEGETIKIVNGYVSEFNGTKQLSAGKFGRIEVAGGNGESKKDEPKAKPAKAKVSKDVEEVEF